MESTNLQVKRNSLKSLPETPGVYIFKVTKLPIYVGKAKNLKNRVGTYFQTKLEPKTDRMIKEADNFSYIKTDSELESLLLEAHLIKKHQPRYNSAAKDDKHPLYIRITKEKYPRIITARKLDERGEGSLAFFGPFPSSTNVHSVLRIVRKVFPFSDHKIGKRGCLYSHIGLCNPCPNEIEKIEDQRIKKTLKGEYLANIRMVKWVLSRRVSSVLKNLYKKMGKLSKKEKFESAASVREQIEKLNYITQPIIPAEYFLENPNLLEDIREKELRELKKMLSRYIKVQKLLRIECFDVAHLSGTNPTASMVTFIRGEPEKNLYRRFRIRRAKGGDDISALAEVAGRRVKYLKTWGVPNLIIVDGGRAQVSAFCRVFRQHGIPVVGLAKNFEKLVFPEIAEGKTTFRELSPKGPALNLVQRIRDEAHRFARRYHHHLIKTSLIQ